MQGDLKIDNLYNLIKLSRTLLIAKKIMDEMGVFNTSSVRMVFIEKDRLIQLTMASGSIRKYDDIPKDADARTAKLNAAYGWFLLR